MLKSKLFAFPVLVAALLMTGCGKQASNAAQLGQVERVTAFVPHSLVSSSSSKPAVGVYVDGRWYAKGDEPAPAKTTEVPAPAEGKGNLHVIISLKGVGGFAGSMVLSLKDGSDNVIATKTFHKADMRGTTIDSILSDIVPGSYTLCLDTLNTSGGVYAQTTADVEVIGDTSIDTRI